MANLEPLCGQLDRTHVLQQVFQQTRSTAKVDITLNETTVVGNKNIIQGNAQEISDMRETIEASDKKMTDEHKEQMDHFDQTVGDAEERMTGVITKETAEHAAKVIKELGGLDGKMNTINKTVDDTKKIAAIQTKIQANY
ncbi:uncharacterized protein [Argopecten irradians]|uniref:uncharacterized protein n=1 Tax=Argopecten irradians TaxID=31199 RepID=UPI00371B31D0